MVDQNLKQFLEYKAFRLRYLSIISTTQAGSGHATSALSAADLVSALFFYSMHFDPKNPKNPNNDRFILSKGHAAPVLYAAWVELGVLSEKDILTLRQFDSILEGHPTPRFDRVEAATGSLGQGLSIGAGISISAKLDKRDFYTYVLIGDSESSEGQIWEATEIAAYYKLNNLIAILDVNRLGQRGETMYGYDIQKYVQKFSAFGWNVISIDGHDIPEIIKALDEAKKSKDKPTMIVAKTIKGYGLKSIENKNGYHGKPIPKDELQSALDELYARFPNAVKYNESSYNWHPKIPKIDNNEDQPKQFKLPIPNYKIGDQIETRKVYGQALAALSDSCPELIVLDAEVSNSTYSDILQKKKPEEFIECFIAEQNMISMAVGLYTRNKIPFSSTFACFLSRAFDQLRMAAVSRAALRVCGSHAGVSIGEDGPSQMGLEDIAMFRTLPNSIVLYPSDAVSTYKLVEDMANYKDGISYLRTTRPKTPIIYQNDEEFKIGGCKIVKKSDNDKVCIIAAGITLHEALKAYEELKEENIFISVIDLYSIKPIDKKTIINVTNKSNKKIITVEDHYLAGGLGEAILYELKNEGFKIECLAVTKLPRSGKKEELLAYESIDSHAIISSVKRLI